MKKIALSIGIFILFAAGVATLALAAGDKVRGDEGQGPTEQECVNYDECPYGDESPAH